MTEIADRYRTLAAAFTEKVEGVPPGQWEAQSPCEEWSARDVLKHVAGTTGTFFGFVGRDAPELPSADDDPVAAWIGSRDVMQKALEDPVMASVEYDGMMGRSTFEQSVDNFVCVDLVIHNWDLSRATGQDERLDPAEVNAVLDALAPMDEMLRGPNAFGPRIEPPADADEQTKLLCFVGRAV